MQTRLAVSSPIANPPARLLGRLGDAVLSTDHKQRRCLAVLLLAGLVMLIGTCLMLYGALEGFFQMRQVAIMAFTSVGFTAGFYIAIRSGWNQGRPDPTLALPQTIAAQPMIAWIYAITGPAHPSALVVLVLVMVFGMFNMRAETVRAVSLYTLGLMGLVMAWCAHADPLHYPAPLERFYFVLLATMLAVVSQLSGLLMDMRVRLKTQKQALENALAHIQQIATHDELTGLPNRRNMMEMLQESALRRGRGGLPFYVAMADLDHFKSVNDTWGHATGDQALRAFAAQAQTVLRTTDVIGRWGGEEFLILLPENPPGVPTVGLERLREKLAELQVCAAAPSLRVGFSAGFTRYQEGEPIGQAIERADRALYAAKSAGRNRTVLL